MLRITSRNKLTVFVIVLILIGKVCIAEQKPNLLLNSGAEDGKNEMPSIWFPAYIPADGLNLSRTKDFSHSGQYALSISNTHKYDQTVCNNWAQALQEIPVGRLVRVCSYIRAKDADNVNVCIQCWDMNKKMIEFASTPVIRGNQDWRKFQSDPILVPHRTVSIVVRAALTGLGSVWFDDITVELLEPGNPEVNTTELFGSAQKEKEYSDEDIRKNSVDYFLARIEKPDPGYHSLAALWALEKKDLNTDPNARLRIINRGQQVLNDPNRSGEWLYCYVIDTARDQRAIPVLNHILTTNKDETVRSCAACALGKFGEPEAVEALKNAQKNEQNNSVKDWIQKAISGELRKTKK